MFARFFVYSACLWDCQQSICAGDLIVSFATAGSVNGTAQKLLFVLHFSRFDSLLRARTKDKQGNKLHVRYNMSAVKQFNRLLDCREHTKASPGDWLLPG